MADGNPYPQEDCIHTIQMKNEASVESLLRPSSSHSHSTRNSQEQSRLVATAQDFRQQDEFQKYVRMLEDSKISQRAKQSQAKKMFDKPFQKKKEEKPPVSEKREEEQEFEKGRMADSAKRKFDKLKVRNTQQKSKKARGFVKKEEKEEAEKLPLKGFTYKRAGSREAKPIQKHQQVDDERQECQRRIESRLSQSRQFLEELESYVSHVQSKHQDVLESNPKPIPQKIDKVPIQDASPTNSQGKFKLLQSYLNQIQDKHSDVLQRSQFLSRTQTEISQDQELQRLQKVYEDMLPRSSSQNSFSQVEVQALSRLSAQELQERSLFITQNFRNANKMHQLSIRDSMRASEYKQKQEQSQQQEYEQWELNPDLNPLYNKIERNKLMLNGDYNDCDYLSRAEKKRLDLILNCAEEGIPQQSPYIIDTQHQSSVDHGLHQYGYQMSQEQAKLRLQDQIERKRRLLELNQELLTLQKQQYSRQQMDQVIQKVTANSQQLKRLKAKLVAERQNFNFNLPEITAEDIQKSLEQIDSVTQLYQSLLLQIQNQGRLLTEGVQESILQQQKELAAKGERTLLELEGHLQAFEKFHAKWWMSAQEMEVKYEQAQECPQFEEGDWLGQIKRKAMMKMEDQDDDEQDRQYQKDQKDQKEQINS